MERVACLLCVLCVCACGFVAPSPWRLSLKTKGGRTATTRPWSWLAFPCAFDCTRCGLCTCCSRPGRACPWPSPTLGSSFPGSQTTTSQVGGPSPYHPITKIVVRCGLHGSWRQKSLFFSLTPASFFVGDSLSLPPTPHTHPPLQTSVD